jgi:pimeloyl-ACP methyl ester carboxylesterase
VIIREHTAMSDAVLHRWTASDGIELAYHELGEGKPVILMHGLFSDSQMNWINFGHAARIASEGYRVIMPDHRAHGASGKPHDPANYPADILVRDLKGLIAHLGLKEFDLGGFSLGARTTIDAAGSGIRPRRAILGGTGLDVLTNWERRCRFFSDAIEFMRTMKIDLVAAKLLLQGLGDHPSPEQALASFTMPTLVVCGSEDDENGSARELAASLPNAEYKEIPGTHMSSVTKPDLGEAIATFLAA